MPLNSIRIKKSSLQLPIYQCCSQGLMARGQGQGLEAQGQGQGLSSRTTTLGYSEEWLTYCHISVNNI